jgi:hypothetical protein
VSRDRLISELEDWRVRHNAGWALTLSLGVSPIGRFDPDASLKPQLRKLFRNLEREVFGLSRRASERQARHAAFFFAGLYESHDKFGRPWPHLHGAIALGGHSEALLRGVLRDRWGSDEQPKKPAVVAVNHVAVPCPSREIAPRGVVNRHNYRPSFSLKPILSANWLGGYSAKSIGVRKVSIWPAPDILNLRPNEAIPLAA